MAGSQQASQVTSHPGCHTETGRLCSTLPPRLDWFVHTQAGPMAQHGIPEWFHGTISREASEDLLGSQPQGAFLIRVSQSHVGYTLSYKAHDGCRHYMVKLLDDGNLHIPGNNVAHASLEALVTFHQRTPLRPHGELLTQPCGQKDLENTDYEDLFLYSNSLAEEAASPDPGPPDPEIPCKSCSPEETPAKPVLLQQARETTSAATQGGPDTTSCPHKGPFEETRQKLWKSLRMLPQAGRRVQQQLKSHLKDSRLQGPRTRDDSQEHMGDSKDPPVAPFLQNPAEPQAHRDKVTSSKKASRSTSWSEAATRVRAWQGMLVKSLSTQTSKPEPMDSAEAQDWLPEEYLPPPPFAPGYC